MRVILMHNPTAGSGDHSAEDLADEISRAGHQLLCDVTSGDDLTAALAGCELVAVAGGDGTVDKATHVLRGTGVPFTVLPLGTANNVARALGLRGAARELIRAWQDCVLLSFDTAIASCGDDAEHFIEGFGFGAFPQVMRQTGRVPDLASPDETLARDLKLLRARIADAPLDRYALSADGEDLSGEYLMVEILNIPFIGPGFTLAPGATPSDGALDVVLVGDPERELLIRGVELAMSGGEPTLALPARQAARIVVRGGSRRHHRDGDLIEEPIHHVEVAVDAGALRVLAPRPVATTRAWQEQACAGAG